jgi:hypothetical protein
MKKLIFAVAILLFVSGCQSSRSSHTRYLGTAYSPPYSVDRSGARWIELPSSSSRSTYTYPYYSYSSTSTSTRPRSSSADWIEVSSSTQISPYRSSWSYSTPYRYTPSRIVSRTTVPWSVDTNWIEIPSSTRSAFSSSRASGYNPASWRTQNWVSPTSYRSTSTSSWPSTAVRSSGTGYTVPAKVSSPVYIGPVYGTVNVYP